MQWTNEQKVEWLLQQPWRIRMNREDDGSYFAAVDGLEGAVADGTTAEEFQENFWSSLRATLTAYLAAGDQIPLPDPVPLPWDLAVRERRRVKARLVGAGIDVFLAEPATS